MLKIKIRRIKQVILPQIIRKGDWIDLYIPSHEGTDIRGNELKLIPLGIAMQLPDGYEAIMVARSSTPKNYKIITANSLAIIDNSYSGDNDEWKFAALAFEDTHIDGDTRICQFRIQLSQKATFWQKLKWLFTSKIVLEEVEHLNSTNRGGFGSTGK